MASKRPDDLLLLKFTTLALSVCRRHLAPYSCPKSRRTFTQPQLMTCLLLKTYLGKPYRTVCELLALSDGLRDALGLAEVPHYSTLKKFDARVADPALAEGLLATLVAELDLAPGEAVAMDSTGLDPRAASAHFRAKTDKAGRPNPGYVKVSVVVTCTSLVALTLAVSWGPRNDLCEAPQLLAKAFGRARPSALYADAGYDAEWVHRWCREKWLVRSVIPAVPKSPDGAARTKYRRLMQPVPRDAGRRWAVETFFSGLKRTTGAALRARGYASQLTEAAIRVLTYSLRRC